MEKKIITCMTCKNKLKVGVDIKKYKCIYCDTEYEYAEIIEDDLIEMEDITKDECKSEKN